MSHTAGIDESRYRYQVSALVLATLASQALLVVLGPTIVAISADLDAPVGATGQARTITAATAVMTSLLLTRRMERVGVRVAILAGAGLALAASAAVAATVGLPQFLLAHVLVGLAMALLLSGGFAGVADLPQERRAGALGITAAANAMAWIVVNPLAGLLTAAASWRAAHLVPAFAALTALAAAMTALPRSVGRARAAVRLREVLALPGARRWVFSETMAYAAWTGFLTFAGAYLIETLELGEATVGWLLATGPAAYIAASTSSARLARVMPRRVLVAIAASAMAVLLNAQFAWRGSVVWATTGFCLIGAFAGIRTPASARLGMAHGRGHPAAMMTVRTAATQTGYLVGALAGGAVIEAGGYAALGLVLAAAMALSALVVLTVESRPE